MTVSAISKHLVGAQTPRIRRARSGPFSHGPDACEFAQGYGLEADPWQAQLVGDWLTEDSYGLWVHGRGGVSVARQNGKNAALEIFELYLMVALGYAILHTAHEVKTARAAFLRLAGFFENARDYPELAAEVSAIRKTNGQEAIELFNGGSIKFIARSKSSGRGFTADTLVCDEAQELTDEQLEALLPTISAAPHANPLQIYTGTPPGPAIQGEVFRRVRAQGVAGTDPRLAWSEWSIPDDLKARPVIESAKTGDEEALERVLGWVADNNPALGSRLSHDVIMDELNGMSPDGFARERLGQWSADSKHGGPAFDMSRWGQLLGDRPLSAREVVAVEFAWDGSGVAMAGALRPSDGPTFIEGIEERSMADGTLWASEAILSRWHELAQIVVHGRGMAEAFINVLRERGIRNKTIILVPSLTDVKAAHAMFEDAYRRGDISHAADPSFDEQVQAAVKQPIGRDGGFGWTAPEGKSVLTLNAATFAHWGAAITKRRGATQLGGGVVLTR